MFPATRPWPPAAYRLVGICLTPCRGRPCYPTLGDRGFCYQPSLRAPLAGRTQSRGPAPLRRSERLRRPFQESARRDFEPLAPNGQKLGRQPAISQDLVWRLVNEL